MMLILNDYSSMVDHFGDDKQIIHKVTPIHLKKKRCLYWLVRPQNDDLKGRIKKGLRRARRGSANFHIKYYKYINL